MNTRRRITTLEGFTLVELLVVIAIIGVLVALLLPAVQAAREAARRMSCANNVKNIALAIHNFEGSNKTFPYGIHYGRSSPACQVTGSACSIPMTGKGWIVDILPYLEQQAMYDGMKLGFDDPSRPAAAMRFQVSGPSGRGMGRGEIREFVTRPLPLLTCPSDDSGGTREGQFWWPGVEVAVTNYKGVLGDNVIVRSLTIWGANPGDPNDPGNFGSLPDCHDNDRGDGCNGIFWRNSYANPITFRRVSDGMSNTFMIGETVAEQDPHSTAYFSDGDWAGCNMPLNFFDSDPETIATTTRWANVRGFRSRHPGGAHFATADASVHFINEGIDHLTYRALATKAGEETVGSESL